MLSNFSCDSGKATPFPTPSKRSPTLRRRSMPETTNPHSPHTPTATLPTRRLFMPTMLPPTPPLLKLETPMPSELEPLELPILSPPPELPTTSTMLQHTPLATSTIRPLTLQATSETLLFQMPLLLPRRLLLDIPQADMLPPTPRNSSLI